MTRATLLRRSLTYYWRTNIAVIAGVAIAVSVLAGALLVGHSVRASLRRLVLERLGNAASAVVSAGFFREDLAPSSEQVCPLIVLRGTARHQTSGRLASDVLVYGVDERFWRFHGRAHPPPSGREIFLSEALARELSPTPGDGILVRIERPSFIPAESLHGRKEDLAATVRFSFSSTVPAGALGEFSLEPRQGFVNAAFVALDRLQRDLLAPGRVNTLLLAGSIEDPQNFLKQHWQLEDIGVRIRELPRLGMIQLEHRSGLLSDSLALAARRQAERMKLRSAGIFTYLANEIRGGGRSIPYSLVTATELEPPAVPGGLVLNEWAAHDLRVAPGDSVTLEYYLWQPDGRLTTASKSFKLARIVPITPDPALTPEYPGITDSDDVAAWDPPFPVDLSRIRPRDEHYWDAYRTTPKAFLPLSAGQQLWQSRWGRLTALRLAVPEGDPVGRLAAEFRRSLREALDPSVHGLTVRPVRQQGFAASRGATDFGAYFTYFSFFLVVSALLLAGLFFRFGVEQRVRETGLLSALGCDDGAIRKLFVTEGAILVLLGALAGVAGALVYGAGILYGLRTWWLDAVGTTLIRLQADALCLAAGAAGGVLAGLLALLITLRSLRRVPPRQRLAGVSALPPSPGASRKIRASAVAAALAGVVLLAAAVLDAIPDVAGFFGAGALLLAACLFLFRLRLAGERRSTLRGAGFPALLRLGCRNASWRPGRSVLCVALIASAIFILVAVDAFRLTAPSSVSDPSSGTGGFPYVAESLLPIYHNPATPEGRRELNLERFDRLQFVPLRLRPGDDVSCLNLYLPQNPRVLGAPSSFLQTGRFAFQDSLAQTGEEKANPWLLLLSTAQDGAVPAAADANSLTYVLHRKLGDVVEIPLGPGRFARLRLVAALSRSIFQRELIISEENFLRLFPAAQGYRVFLIDTPRPSFDVAELEETLAGFGFDVTPTGERLAGFFRVENTYLSTFQALGALGLLLGTAGLAVVLLRNVLERRRELALLRAVGYRPRSLVLLTLVENAFLLLVGTAVGAVTALLAIVPALSARGGSLSMESLSMLLVAVFASGLLASAAAALVVARSPLLEALRSE